MSHEPGLDRLGTGSYCSSLPCLTGGPPPSSWENKDIYAAAIRSLRLRELQNMECVTAVRAGLGSIIPLQLLTTLSPLEMELRTCGLPYINLEFLKVGGPHCQPGIPPSPQCLCSAPHAAAAPPCLNQARPAHPGPFFPRPTPCTRWG